MQQRPGTGFTSTILDAGAVGARIEQAEQAARARPHTSTWLSRLDGVANTLLSDVSAAAAVSRKRRDESELSDAQRAAFTAAVQKLVDDGTYATLVAFHMDMSHNMHGAMGAIGLMRFLAWHRRFILEFETRLQAADRVLRPTATEALCLPYWSWQNPFPAWLDGFLPAVDPASNEPPEPRTLAPPPEKPSAGDIDLILTGFRRQMPGSNVNDYVRFTYGLEGWGVRPDGSSLPAHNHVHDWVGGIMSNTSTSPTDPIFWLHHAEVDRLWHIWQLSNPSSHPPLTGTDRVMDPWSESYDELVSIASLGYAYSRDQP